MPNLDHGGIRQSVPRWARAVALLAVLLPVASAVALPDDRDQPIRITADTVIRDEKQGFTLYSGNVHMIQGSMDIEADELTIYHTREEAEKIVAQGTPAKLKQQPEIDEAIIHAEANIIEYYQLEERVHLRVNAHITQDGASVAGDSIDYFIAEQLVRADSEPVPDSNRVQVVIPAQVVKRETGSDDDEDKKAPDGTPESN